MNNVYSIRAAVISCALATLSCLLNAQNVPENIHYQFKSEYYRNAYFGRQTCANPRRVVIPGIPGYKAYKADLHCHTIFSDGEVTPMMRVMEAWMEDLDILAITDHHPNPRTDYDKGDRNASYNEAAKYASEVGLKLIKGFELTAGEPVGHLCLLFLGDLNKYKMTLPVEPDQADRIIAMALEDKAFITSNHPGWPDQNSSLSDYIVSHIENGDIGAMEVFNSCEYYPLAIDHCNRYGLAMIAATDTHYPTYYQFDQEDNHRPMTIIFAKDDSDDSLKEALQAGRTIAWADNNLFGPKDLVSKFIRSCIKIERIKESGNTVRCRLFNDSAVPYVLECSDPKKIIKIPAGAYAEFTRDKSEFYTQYTVSNVHVGSSECLRIPLAYLLQGDSEASMPFIDETSVQFGEDGLSFRLITTDGETYYTTDGSAPGPQATKYDGETVRLSKSGTLRAVSVKDGSVSKDFTRELPFSMAVKVKKLKPGVSFTMYEHKDILSTKDIEIIGVPVLDGVYSGPCITDGIGKDHFGYIFKGYITAPKSGLYEFKLLTNDGSDLFIGGQIACDNDQSRGYRAKSGFIFLQEGIHPLLIRYFEGYGGESFELHWKCPGSPVFVPVPDGSFFHN